MRCRQCQPTRYGITLVSILRGMELVCCTQLVCCTPLSLIFFLSIACLLPQCLFLIYVILLPHNPCSSDECSRLFVRTASLVSQQLLFERMTRSRSVSSCLLMSLYYAQQHTCIIFVFLLPTFFVFICLHCLFSSSF